VTLTVGSDSRKKYAIELPITPPPITTTLELTPYSTSNVAALKTPGGANGLLKRVSYGYSSAAEGGV